MSSVYIMPLVEQAAVAFLGAQTYAQADSDEIILDATRIIKGFQRAATIEEEAAMPLPVAICSCLSANNEEDTYTGNWIAELIVELRKLCAFQCANMIKYFLMKVFFHKSP